MTSLETGEGVGAARLNMSTVLVWLRSLFHCSSSWVSQVIHRLNDVIRGPVNEDSTKEFPTHTQLSLAH